MGRNNGMRFVHLYTGPDGKSHFRDVEVEMKDAGNMEQISEPMKATGIYFRVTGPNYHHDWANAPCRQLVITIEGEIEVTASDGTKRREGPGDISLADDTTGQGHITRVVSNKPRKSIHVTLE
jgi:hypothetical protein